MKQTLILSVLVMAAFSWEAVSQQDDPFSHMSNLEFAEKYLSKLGSEDELSFKPYSVESEVSHPGYLNWDWRNESNCVHEIREQGSCGSCWAFGVSEFLSDRFCIHSKGVINETMSPEFLVECDNDNYTSGETGGCAGAMTQQVVDWVGKNGIISETCDPYYSGINGTENACHNLTCTDPTVPWRLYKAENATHYNKTNIESYMAEIGHNGPIYMSMQVMSDFRVYKSGVFVAGPDAKPVGGHAIKVIGWGEIEGTTNATAKIDSLYWIAANSWGKRWGDKGYFKIAMNQTSFGYLASAIKPIIPANRIVDLLRE